MSFMLALSATACSKETSQDSILENQEDSTIIETAATEEIPVQTASGQEIYWLADYNINPLNTQDRSPALALFEDQYGGKINWIWCITDAKYDILTSRLLSGEPVDMVSYDEASFPQGVMQERFQPLDDYLDLNDTIWDDMRGAIDMYAYHGQHYVVPYAVSDPLLLIYSRQMCQENHLDDPYELYQSGNWTWESFMSMMQEFVAGDAERYGICGQLGQGILQSTGKNIIDFDGDNFSSHISDPAIAEAENFLQEIHDANLYDAGWYANFPSENHILFYAMQDWALDKSNAVNRDADFMAVPFPKAPDAEDYYLSGNYEAKMLVKNSDKGEAVAAYIYCERLARTEETYKQIAKQNALQQQVSAVGAVLSYRTEEQYNAILSYQQNLKTIFDFGYGMGSTMYGNGEYTYQTRGVMNNLTEAVLEGHTWSDVQQDCSSKIDSVLQDYSS